MEKIEDTHSNGDERQSELTRERDEVKQEVAQMMSEKGWNTQADLQETTSKIQQLASQEQ